MSNPKNINDVIHDLNVLILDLQKIHDEHWIKSTAKGTTSKRILRVLSILNTQFQELDDLEILVNDEMKVEEKP